MEKIRTLKNLGNILRKSYEWRQRNLSDDESPIPFKILTNFNFIIVLISIVTSLFINDISSDFVNAILTFTAIFATLIIPVLILVYDKFSKNPNSHLSDIESQSSEANRRLNLHRNFTRRYIFVTLENIIISIIIIVAIIIYKSLLVDYLKIFFWKYDFILNYNHIQFKLFLKLAFVLLLKTCFSLLLIKFIYFLFFSIGAIGDFFISIFEEK